MSNQTWDSVVEQTAVTSNPAAGVLSVDVKTFTGRGRVSAVEFSCVADATVASRVPTLQKVSGANVLYIAVANAFAASMTGYMTARRGWSFAPAGVVYAAIADVNFAPGDILRVVVNSGQAGDDLSAITYSCKEML